MAQFILDRDLFGHPITVHFRGKNTYGTWLGSFCTLAAYILMFVNVVLLGTSYRDGYKQEEMVDFQYFDRFDSPRYYLHENGVNITLFAPKIVDIRDENDGRWISSYYEPLRPEIGAYWITQYYPCDEGDDECKSSAKGRNERRFEFKDCPEQQRADLNAYWNERNKSWLDLGLTAQCILDDTERTLHIQGDANARTTSSKLQINFVACKNDTATPNLVCQSEEDIEAFLTKSALDIQFDFEQIDMKNFDHPVQNIRKLYAYKVLADQRQTILFELGPNIFEDFRDILGFFRSEPDEHIFFQIEKESVDKISPYRKTETRVKIELSDLERSHER